MIWGGGVTQTPAFPGAPLRPRRQRGAAAAGVPTRGGAEGGGTGGGAAPGHGKHMK